MLGDAIDLILDGGPAHGGPASTVVDCTGDAPRILRDGAAMPRALPRSWRRPGIAATGRGR